MMDLEERTLVAQSLVSDAKLLDDVTAELVARHPEVLIEPLADDEVCTLRDKVRLQLSYLAGAVQAGNPWIFGECAAFGGALLVARNADRANLRTLMRVLEGKLCAAGQPARDLLERMFACAHSALSSEITPFQEPTDAPTPLRLAYLSAALSGRRADAWQVTRDARACALGTAEIYELLPGVSAAWVNCG